jgi:gas vesicle protein
MSAKQFLVGTISGIVAGAVVGLILAPQSGKETREQIAKKANDLKKKMADFASQSAGNLDELQDIFKTEIAGLSNDVRERVLRLIKESKSVLAAENKEDAEQKVYNYEVE